MTESRLTDIYNFRQLDDRIATAGQPTQAQLAHIAAAGYEVVVNLVPPGAESALADERGTVRELGMVFEHIPVVWAQPTAADLDAFFTVMDRHAHRRVFVHCVANMRVSAFMMLYRVLRLGWVPDDALPDLHALWRPEGVWKEFVEEALRSKED